MNKRKDIELPQNIYSEAAGGRWCKKSANVEKGCSIYICYSLQY